MGKEILVGKRNSETVDFRRVQSTEMQVKWC